MQRTSQVHFQHFINLFGLVLILTHGLDPQNFFSHGKVALAPCLKASRHLAMSGHSFVCHHRGKDATDF